MRPPAEPGDRRYGVVGLGSASGSPRSTSTCGSHSSQPGRYQPRRLVELGLLDERREERGRRRRLFAITPAGRAALQDWLLEPSAEPPQLRDLGLLKLFLSSLTDEDAVRALARAQAASHRERLARYEAIEAAHPGQAVGSFPLATLRMGLLLERAIVASGWASPRIPPCRPAWRRLL